MKSDWKKVPLSEIAELTVGFVGTMAKHYVEKGIPFLRSTNISPFKIDLSDIKYISPDFNEKISKSQLNKDDVVIVRTGKPGTCAIIPDKDIPWNCSDLVIIRPDKNKVLPLFLAAHINLSGNVINSQLVGAVQQHFNVASAKNMSIFLPPIEEQKKICSVIGAILDKIELNNKINDNLQQQAQALYKQMFVNTYNGERKKYRAEDFFEIAIGKTPPRKESQWFSKNTTDRVWVSISDMGSCGLFISDSSEYLTQAAVDKFNVKAVPDNTVLLSFKLTVGRVAITDGEMTTNEAIAHFKTSKPDINEYLYYYLKNFNYQTMGSTSSIATAVNSKIIKGMPFVVPTNKELEYFHRIVAPLFSKIKNNQRENKRLSQLRDALLPKLMSGEIDVSNIQT